MSDDILHIEIAQENAEHSVPALLARIDELTAALSPFAAVAEKDIGDDETDEDLFRPMQRLFLAPRLTVGDLRRALRVLR